MTVPATQYTLASDLSIHHNLCSLLQGLPHRYNARPLRLVSLRQSRHILRPCTITSGSSFNHQSTVPYYASQLRPTYGPTLPGHYFAGRPFNRRRGALPVASHMGPADYAWTANLNAAEVATPEMVSKLSLASMQPNLAFGHRSGVHALCEDVEQRSSLALRTVCH